MLLPCYSFDLSSIRFTYSEKYDDWYIDDFWFFKFFGIGDENLVVYHDSVTKNVVIRARFDITGNGADIIVPGEVRKTYTEAFLLGIENNWSGCKENDNGKGYNIAVRVRNQVGGIKVNIINGDGQSTGGPWGLPWDTMAFWSPTNLGSITMYTARKGYANSDWDSFGIRASHEFGHILGLKNYYENRSTIMSAYHLESKVTVWDINAVLKAWYTKKSQRPPIHTFY